MRVQILKQSADGIQTWIDITEFVKGISVKFPDDATIGQWIDQPEGNPKTRLVDVLGGNEFSTIEITITVE